MATYERSHPPVRREWLALIDEAPLDPERVIVDPHHHLWERAESPYAPDDLLADIAGCGHNVVATVLIEANAHYREGGEALLAPVGEVEFAVSAERAAASLGATIRPCAAIVGHADLTHPDVGRLIDTMIEAGAGRLAGIRASSVHHSDPSARGSMMNFPPGRLADGDFLAGFAALGARGLSCDAWMYHTQLDELTSLARRFAGTPIVLNHCGGPLAIGPYKGRRDEVLRDWRATLHRVAACPNVFIKLGGFGMPFFDFGFSARPAPPTSQELADAIAPYVETAIEAFGPERAMIESNFPVDKAAFGYGIMWNAFKRLTTAFAETEKQRLFAGTAAEFYRIAL